MARPNKVDRLPSSLRAKIIKLLDNGTPLDDVMEALNLVEKGISRSSLGRYKQKTDLLFEKMRAQRAMAEVIVSARRTDLDSKAARFNVHVLQSIITDITTAVEDGKDGKKMTPSEVAALAKAMDSLGRVEKQDADLTAKIRAEAKLEAIEEAQKNVDAMLKEGRDPREMSTEELRQAISDAMRK